MFFKKYFLINLRNNYFNRINFCWINKFCDLTRIVAFLAKTCKIMFAKINPRKIFKVVTRYFSLKFLQIAKKFLAS